VVFLEQLVLHRILALQAIEVLLRLFEKMWASLLKELVVVVNHHHYLKEVQKASVLRELVVVDPVENWKEMVEEVHLNKMEKEEEALSLW